VTPLNPILLDIKVRFIFIAIGVIGIAAIYLAYRKKEIGMNRSKGPLQLLDLENHDSASHAESSPAAPSGNIPAPQVPTFQTFQSRPWVISDLFRAFLILLSLIVAAGFILILLSQPTVDRMARDLQSQYGTSQQDRIALLELWDGVKDDEFEVRGVVRNISNTPIEQMDAAVRLYSHNGGVLETVLVRMDRETIAPDNTAQFRLIYPNYKKEFSSYAVEFKVRQGALMTYKDMRSARLQTNRNP
jgi:hypothetical protein